MKEILIFAVGSVAYPLIEISWRGYTHYTMGFAGGLSLLLIDKLCCERYKSSRFLVRCALGSYIITLVEFATGIIINKVLLLHVWDYSSMPMNILGQICLPFSIIWFFISIPAIKVCEKIRNIIDNIDRNSLFTEKF